MKNYILIILLALLCPSCMGHISHKSTPIKMIQGYAYNLISEKGLNGAFILNITARGGVVTDSIGRFSLTANVGDSICVQYVGMKDSIIVLSNDTPSYLKIGLDTLYLPLTDSDIITINQF